MSTTVITPSELIEQIHKLLDDHAVEADALPMKKYMRDLFPFKGVKGPARQEIVKHLQDTYRLTGLEKGKMANADSLIVFMEQCWEQPWREFQYIAMALGEKHLRLLQPEHLPALEQLILHKSWWDTIDWLAPKAVGSILRRFPEYVESWPDRWIEADNFWLQRSAILFQLKYKTRTDFERLAAYILKRASSREFFVQKAAGWALREYSKTEGLAVQEFIDQHPELPPLTRREGLKWLNRQV